MKNFDVYHKNERTASVKIGISEVLVERYVLHPVKQIFPKDRLTRFEFGRILRSRCWEEGRENIQNYLDKLGLDSYDPYEICQRTHGVKKNDFIWFKFEGENIKAEDVLCRQE